jgi:hypothetical protein
MRETVLAETPAVCATISSVTTSAPRAVDRGAFVFFIVPTTPMLWPDGV